MDKKKMANNILEFLVDPTRVPVERRLYIGPEEILDNRSYEMAKMEANQAYGNQSQNSDFYPNRNRTLLKREGSQMDRRTLIASFDILSQSFKNENDPIAKDLRTMAYAVANMSEEELAKRVAEKLAEQEGTEKTAGNPWMDHMKKVRKDNPGKSVKELIDIAKKTYKKKASEEDVTAAEEMLSEDVDAEASAEEVVEIDNDNWNKQASDAVLKAILADSGVDATMCGDKKKDEEEDKTAGKKKGPGVPDGTGPMSDSDACPMKKEEKKEAGNQNKPPKSNKKMDEEKWAGKDEEAEEAQEDKKEAKNKDYETEPGRQPQEEGDIEEKHKKAEEKAQEEDAEESKKADEDKEAEENVVDTSMLANTDIEGYEFTASTTDAAELSETDHKNLDQIFRLADVEGLDENEKAKLDQLFS